MLLKKIEENEMKKKRKTHLVVMSYYQRAKCTQTLSSHDAVCIVPAAAIISISWDIRGAGDREEYGEGIHEFKLERA